MATNSSSENEFIRLKYDDDDENDHQVRHIEDFTAAESRTEPSLTQPHNEEVQHLNSQRDEEEAISFQPLSSNIGRRVEYVIPVRRHRSLSHSLTPIKHGNSSTQKAMSPLPSLRVSTSHMNFSMLMGEYSTRDRSIFSREHSIKSTNSASIILTQRGKKYSFL
jgi:hypothetical protein